MNGNKPIFKAPEPQSNQLSDCISQAVVRLAKLAGKEIMTVYARGSEDIENNTSAKADSSPLTEADLASHHAIVDGLSKLSPDIPVASEEDAASLMHRMAEGMFWLVDPLDGTKEFLARNGEFTVNIALIASGEPVWGVVHAPAIEQTYWGGSQQGAFKQVGEGDPMRLTVVEQDLLSVEGNQTPIRVVASKSHLNEATDAFINRLGAVALVQAGSSLKFCRVAENGADVYPRLAPTCEWDTAAAQAVLEGAGGHVFDMDGQRLRYGKLDMLNPSFIAALWDHSRHQSRLHWVAKTNG